MARLLAMMLLTSGALAADLETETYRINIESRCGEGHVTCDDVLFSADNRRSGATLGLIGETWHTLCADGSTCRFLGYRFVDDNIIYLVHQSGLLEVVAGGDGLLLSEQGEWQEEPIPGRAVRD